MLCSQQIMRASNVVMNGLLLTCIRLEAPELSLRISGEAPCSSASFGTRYRSPEPNSTYAPGPGMSCHDTSGNRDLCCGSVETFLASVPMIGSLYSRLKNDGEIELSPSTFPGRGNGLYARRR